MVIKGLSRALPVTLPRARHRATHRVCHQPEGQPAVVNAAVIFQPSGLVGVLVQVLRADMVVLAYDHAAQAGEVAFRPVGVLAVVAVGH